MTARIRSRPGKRCQALYSSDFIAFRLLNRVIVLSIRETYHIPPSTGRIHWRWRSLQSALSPNVRKVTGNRLNKSVADRAIVCSALLLESKRLEKAREAFLDIVQSLDVG